MRVLLFPLIVLLSLSTNAVADTDRYHFEIRLVTDVGGSVLVEVMVTPGTVKTVSVAGDFLLEFTAPSSVQGSQESMVRLLRRNSDEIFLLHTSRRTAG